VAVVLVPPPEDPLAAKNLELKIRRTLRLFPGTVLRPQELVFATERVRRLPGVASVEYTVTPSPVEGFVVSFTLHLGAREEEAPSLAERVVLFSDGKSLVKLNLQLAGALPLVGNAWFGNGGFFTANSPFGREPPGTHPVISADGVLGLGGAAATPILGGDAPLYVYGNFKYLLVGTVGTDLYSTAPRGEGAVEDAWVGLVGGGSTEGGALFTYHASLGRQPYCIGTGMLVCQTATSGGSRGGLVAWPRWAGDLVGLLQGRWNDTRLEGFYVDPNELPDADTRTRLFGVNLEHEPGQGLGFGVTWLRVFQSTFPYFDTRGPLGTRTGLYAYNVRGSWEPAPDVGSVFGLAEGGVQTHSHFRMRAYAAAAQLGYSAGNWPWRPSLSYRYSLTTGDDPRTSTFERWDLLYSGQDVDTWIHGLLMKNLQFNTNLQTHRIQMRLTPVRQLRLTGQWMAFRADELNNLGGSISTFQSAALGQEALLVTEHFVSPQVYVRGSVSLLWPGSGVTGALPSPTSTPWYTVIVQANLNY
jgi:hypothetical protein